MMMGACSEALAWEQKKADSDLFETSGEAASVQKLLGTPVQKVQKIQTLQITTVAGNITELSTIIYF